MNILVRTMRVADHSTWAQMRQQLWPSQDAGAHLLEILAATKRRKLRGFIAVDEAGQPVGFAEVSVRDYANGCTGQPVPFLEGIWVAPKARHSGVGRALVEHLAADLAARGFQELCSDADITNTLSHEAHQSWGFAETERVVYFRRPLIADRD